MDFKLIFNWFLIKKVNQCCEEVYSCMFDFKLMAKVAISDASCAP